MELVSRGICSYKFTAVPRRQISERCALSSSVEGLSFKGGEFLLGSPAVLAAYCVPGKAEATYKP